MFLVCFGIIIIIEDIICAYIHYSKQSNKQFILSLLEEPSFLFLCIGVFIISFGISTLI